MITLLKPQEFNRSGITRPAPVNGAFDIHLVAPFVRDAELRFLKPVLGKIMLERMRTLQNEALCNYNEVTGVLVKKFPDSDAESVAFEALWTEHVFEYLAMATHWMALPNIKNQTQSGGFVQISDHNSSQSSAKDMDKILDHHLQILELRKVDMTEWLCDRAEDYPLWDNSVCGSCSKSIPDPYTPIIIY